MSKIQVLFHSSIRIEGEKTVYFDPFKIDKARNDADIVYITHDHYDHFSPEDIKKVVKADTLLVVPDPLEGKAIKLAGKVIAVRPGQEFDADGIKTEVVPAYNIGKLFHPKANNWVGYIVTLDGERCYIAGDTDRNKDNEKVRCDVALVPIGGHFTMDAKEAADLVNIIKPKKAVPTHYGEVAGRPEDAEVFAKRVDKAIDVEIQLKF